MTLKFSDNLNFTEAQLHIGNSHLTCQRTRGTVSNEIFAIFLTPFTDESEAVTLLCEIVYVLEKNVIIQDLETSDRTYPL